MMEREAWISEDGDYRYTLFRGWTSKPDPDLMGWIMLNPSKADANIDDRTIKKCMATAARWGYDGMFVVNLFALRSTDPGEIDLSSEPIGPENDGAIAEIALNKCDLIVAAWGVPKTSRIERRIRDVLKIVFPRPLHALALSKGGHPRHPLYLPYVAKPLLWAQAKIVDGEQIYQYADRSLSNASSDV